MIQNQEILTRLAAWKSGLGDLEESEGIMVRYAYEVLQPYINSHAAYRSISSYSRDGVFAGAPSAFPDGLLELLTDREFESHIEMRRTETINVLGKYDAVRASLQRLRSLIQEELER